MAEYNITAEWKENIAFEAQVENHLVRMDSSGSDGSDSGASPKRLVLAGLLGCTGMDVASLLKKMRVPFESLTITGRAPITEEHPKTFAKVELKYVVKGKDIKRDKVVRAIELSQEKYCGVSIMIGKHCPVTWELKVVDLP